MFFFSIDTILLASFLTDTHGVTKVYLNLQKESFQYSFPSTEKGHVSQHHSQISKYI